MTFHKDGGTHSFMILSDSPWYIRCETAEDTPFFKVSPEKGENGIYEITIDVDALPNLVNWRAGDIHFYIGEDKQATFTITQSYNLQ